MPESLYCPEQKASSPEFREGYDQIEWEKPEEKTDNDPTP